MSAFPDGAGRGPAEDDDAKVDGAAGADADASAAPAGGLGAPEAELARTAAERDEYLEALRRLQAEFDNYRKRMTREQTELLDRATEGLLERLLPVLDALDLALQHRAGAPEGGAGDDGGAFNQIASLLTDALARNGLERIDAVGVHFDPAIHDAVAHLPAPEEAGAPEAPPTAGAPAAAGEAAAQAANGAEAAPPAGEGARSTVVAEVLRAGYRLKGRVLRPAMVTVQG